MTQIKIVYSDKALPIVKATEGSAGWDIRAAEDAKLVSLRVTMVDTGVKLAIPKGYEVQVRSRSGLASKGICIANGVGTIDSDYRGEVKVLMYCIFGEKEIKRGDRIAQLVINKVHDVEFVSVYELDDTQRGSGGFGSTGR